MASAESAADFDAFISYSRRDGAFAERLHRALDRYTPPSGLGRHPGRLRVFRDTADFAGAEYFSAVEAHLRSSAKLILVCSPASAASTYVNGEIERFIALHGAEHVVPVLWQGLPNNEAGEAQAKQRAFAPALVRALAMPLAADFRGFDTRSGKFDSDTHRPAWTLLLANLLGASRAEVEQREQKRRRARRRAWTLALSSVFAALLALALWALFEGERALARQLAAQAALRGGTEPQEVQRRALVARDAVLRHERLGEASLDADTALRDALAHLPRRRLALPPGERALAFSADGEHLFVAEGAALAVHSLADGAVRRKVVLEHPLRALAVSADAQWLAGIDRHGAPRLWSWPALSELPLPALPAPLHCLAFVTFAGREARLVALHIAADDARRILLLQWRPGQQALEAQAQAELPQAVTTPDDGCLEARAAGRFDPAVGGLLVPLTAEPGAAAGIAFEWELKAPAWSGVAPRPAAPIRHWGGIVLAARGDTVLLDDKGNIQRPRRLDAKPVPAPRDWNEAAAFSRDGGWLLGMQGLHDPMVPLLKPTRIDIVDTRNGMVVRSLADHAGFADFVPDGETVVTVSGRRIRLWDRRDGRERLRIQAIASVQRLRFDAGSRHLLAVAADGSAEVFDIGAADEHLRLAAGGPALLVGTPERPLLGSGARLLLPPASTGALPAVLELGGYVQLASTSTDGRFVVAGVAPEAPLVRIGDAPGIELVLVDTGGDRPTVRHRGQWGDFRFDRAGRRLLVAGRDGEARMVDTASGRVLWSRAVGKPVEPPAVALVGWRAPMALADDGSVAALPTPEGLVLLAGDDGRVIRAEAQPAGGMALSGDGRLLARLARDDHVEVVQVNDGRVLHRFGLTPVGTLRDLVFSPGGRRLLAFGGTTFSTFMSGGHFAEEHGVVWSLAGDEPALRVPATARTSAEYEEEVSARGDESPRLASMVWNRHTREFAGTWFPSLLAYYTVPSGMVRGTLMAWRLTDDGVEPTYRAAADETLSPVAFAAAGGALLVKGEDGALRLIDLRREHVLQAACTKLTRTLDARESAAALGGGWRSPMPCPANFDRKSRE